MRSGRKRLESTGLTLFMSPTCRASQRVRSASRGVGITELSHVIGELGTRDGPSPRVVRTNVNSMS